MMAVRELSYAEARERVLDAIRPLAPETVPLDAACGRPLRRTITAPHDLPPFANSSMDGYAVRAADLERASPGAAVVLPVVETVAAGAVAARALGAGEAMRIMTGAPIPEGADAVVPFEEAEAIGSGAGERARFVRRCAPGTSVRGAGEDVARGTQVLDVGRELSPHDIALLASLGIAKVEVGRAPRVTLLSTGDELLPVEAQLTPGTIRDSNLPLLEALLRETGCRVLRAVRLPDRAEEVARAIRQSLEVSDVVLTIGGVSAGDFDPVKQALESVGGIEGWRVAMKPGRPQAFGAPDGRLFHGLPGNPASVACVFEALVRPALRRLQGFTQLDRPRVPVRAAGPVDSRVGRTDFVRATLEWRDGRLWAAPAGSQVSGHLGPQSRAHALLVVPEPVGALAEGDPAEALLLRMPQASAS